jgi:hypothetical protein
LQAQNGKLLVTAGPIFYEFFKSNPSVFFLLGN